MIDRDDADTNYREYDGRLEVVRSESDPWFRCRALADVAWRVKDEVHAETLIEESFRAAEEQVGEFNRIVKVSAWPLAVLCKKRKWEAVERETLRLLDIITQEPSPVRRADALLSLAGAVQDAPGTSLRQVLEPFVASCSEPLANGKRNRRGESWLVDALPLIYRCSTAWAEEIVPLIRGEHSREEAMKVLQGLRKGDIPPTIRGPSLT